MDDSASAEAQSTSDNLAERLGVLLGALEADFPDLAAIVEAWPTLPDAIRRAMTSMVEASR